MRNPIRSLLITLLLLISSAAFSQNECLDIFKPFIGEEWIGHYMNSEDSALIHYITWTYCLDNNYVKMVKEVPEVNFKMETIFYFDYENNQISTLSILNKEMYSKGSAQLRDGKLELNYKSYFKNGSSDSKQTFEIIEEGIIKDYFYRKKADKWIQGHYIKYNNKEWLTPFKIGNIYRLSTQHFNQLQTLQE